jgi:hypothetical protein
MGNCFTKDNTWEYNDEMKEGDIDFQKIRKNIVN